MSNNNFANWEETSLRFVAFIDIMGFKDMVARTPHNELYRMLKLIEDKKRKTSNVDWGKVNSKLVMTTNYSDSIMIYSKDSSEEALYSFICTVSGVSCDLFFARMPHKGAVAYGTMTLDVKRSIYFGQPLIDAYLLQEEVNYYGVVVHSTAERAIINTRLSLDQPFTRNYLCPFKSGAANHLTIYPMFASHRSKQNEKYLTSQNMLFQAVSEMRLKTSGSLRKYIDSTETYLKHISNFSEKS